MKKVDPRKWMAAFLLLVACGFVIAGCAHPNNEAARHKVIVLGIDGMDPQLLHQYMRDGRMPNFQRLEHDGSFRELRTSIPPQSPVA